MYISLCTRMQREGTKWGTGYADISVYKAVRKNKTENEMHGHFFVE